jgi:hypothetical protein
MPTTLAAEVPTEDMDGTPIGLVEQTTQGFVGAPVDSDRMHAQKRTADQRNQATLDRLIALRLVMARSVGLSFDEVALMLGVRPERLRAWLHETTSIPASSEPSIFATERMLRLLGSVVRPRATARWFRRPIPRLDNMTPLDAITAGHIAAVMRLVESYADVSFT